MDLKDCLQIRRNACPGTRSLQHRRKVTPKTLGNIGQITPFDLPAGEQWREVRVDLPVKGKLVHLRLYPGAKDGVVDFDWIRLCKDDGAALRVWEFDL